MTVPTGTFENKILALGAVHARTASVRAALGPEMMLETVLDEGRDARIGDDDHIAAVAAVAAVRPAFGHMGLAAKRHAARAAIAAPSR